jgi:hypothetical protein
MSNIIDFTYMGETLSMSPDAIDTDLMKTKSRETIRGWLSTAKDDISQTLRTRFANYLSQPEDDNIPPYRLHYCPDSDVDIVKRFIKKGSQKNLLSGTIYLSSRHHVSCHELLFGTSKPVELFGRTKSFVLLISTVQDEVFKEKIRNCLTGGVLKTDSPMYILRERCIEAGAAQGMSYAEIRSMLLGSPTQKIILDEIYAPDFPYQKEKQNHNTANHSLGFNMVLRDCGKYSVSADYLILQDYSEFAVIEGKALTEQQTEWLSLFLCATPAAQLVSIAILTKYQLHEAQRRAKVEATHN